MAVSGVENNTIIFSFGLILNSFPGAILPPAYSWTEL